MKTTASLIIWLLMAAFILLSSCEKDGVSPEFRTQLDIRATGSSVATQVTRKLPGTQQSITGQAYVLGIYDERTGKSLGTLTDIIVQQETFSDGTMQSENFTFFDFKDSESSIVIHGMVELIPDGGTEYEASIPPAMAMNNVVGGTGIYTGMGGDCNLNAILYLAQINHGIVTFDCLYEMDLELELEK